MAKANLSPGMVIDGFRIEERLHRGGMADIWRVTRADIDFPIVMKAPFLDFESDLPLLVGFEVEQMIMAELTGPHVPRWIANGEFTVQPYIAMEYVDGAPLLKRLASDARLTCDEVVQLGIEIAVAVGDLHEQHVLHLDLKPANILLRPSGEVVLIDFGLSRHEQLPDLLEEQFHQPTGTTEYMAPEQLVRVRSDRRSDIFAVGAILYQAVTGELPFGEASRMAQVRQRVWRDPVPPRVRRSEIPPVLQEIILKCIEPMPDKRYTTAADLLFELRHLDLVELTERAERVQQSTFKTAFQRWWRVGRTMREIMASATKEPVKPPIVLVAVDLRSGMEEVRQALLEGVASVLANTPRARIACLNVMQTSLMSIEDKVDAEGDNIHVKRLADLRAWAQPLDLPRAKVTYHLVETRNVVAGIIDFARSNAVDHLVIGAPAAGGSTRITAQITAEAPCSVTVVRPSAASREARQSE